MKTPILESYWVEENRFLAGEYPGDYNPEGTRRRIDNFLEAGVNTFIDLTHSYERPPYDDILKEQARIYETDWAYHRFSIRDHSIPLRETMVNILNAIDAAIEKKNGVYVHCWGGIGRTGIAVGCWLVRHGMTNEEALARVNQLYRTRPGNLYYPRSPETDEQIQFVLDWRETPVTTHQNQHGKSDGDEA
jgi:hypothetical protein